MYIFKVIVDLVIIGGEMKIIARLFIFCQMKKLSTPPICQKNRIDKSIINNQYPYNREVVDE